MNKKVGYLFRLEAAIHSHDLSLYIYMFDTYRPLAYRGSYRRVQAIEAMISTISAFIPLLAWALKFGPAWHVLEHW